MSAVSHARGRVRMGVMHTAMQNNPQAILLVAQMKARPAAGRDKAKQKHFKIELK